MALTGSASGNFQYTALLLSQHTDVLCDEIVHGVTVEEDPVSPVSIPQGSNRAHTSKRKATVQPPHAAKKVASWLVGWLTGVGFSSSKANLRSCCCPVNNVILVLKMLVVTV